MPEKRLQSNATVGQIQLFSFVKSPVMAPPPLVFGQEYVELNFSTFTLLSEKRSNVYGPLSILIALGMSENLLKIISIINFDTVIR